mgnify:CR=1 FL=1
MRLDKFLKVSRIIKRRPVANTICSNGRVKLNGRIAKPASEVSVGDTIEIAFGSGNVKVEVLEIREHVKKSDVSDLYRIIGGREGEELPEISDADEA